MKNKIVNEKCTCCGNIYKSKLYKSYIYSDSNEQDMLPFCDLCVNLPKSNVLSRNEEISTVDLAIAIHWLLNEIKKNEV